MYLDLLIFYLKKKHINNVYYIKIVNVLIKQMLPIVILKYHRA